MFPREQYALVEDILKPGSIVKMIDCDDVVGVVTHQTALNNGYAVWAVYIARAQSYLYINEKYFDGWELIQQ